MADAASRFQPSTQAGQEEAEFMHAMRNQLAILSANVQVIQRIVATVTDSKKEALELRIGKAYEASNRIEALMNRRQEAMRGTS